MNNYINPDNDILLMAKNQSRKNLKQENQKKPFPWFLWPFRFLFRAVSWTLTAIFLVFERIFLKKSAEETKKYSQKTAVKIEYVPFKIIDKVKGSFTAFESFVAKNPSTIGIILGARGTGKSAIGLKMLENLNSISKKKFYAMGFKQEDMPEWINIVEDVKDIDTGSFVLIDEGGILFSSRKSFSDANKLLSELLLIARHNDLSIMFISQNSANLEINAIRQADYLVLKPSSLLQRDFERKKIKDIYDAASEKFQKYGNTQGLTYIYSEQFTGFVSNPLPSFWSQKVSKSFRKK
jgi:hypothetical protein